MITVKADARRVVATFERRGEEALARVRDQVMTSTVRVLSDAKRLCPVGKTGRLRNSLAFEIADAGFSSVTGTNVEYAPYREFGTGIYAEGGDGRKTAWVYYDALRNRFFTTRGMKPKPYLGPAFRAEAPRFEAALRAILAGGASA